MTDVARKDAETRRVRPPLHPRVVVVAGYQDTPEDRVGGDFGEECVLRQKDEVTDERMTKMKCEARE